MSKRTYSHYVVGALVACIPLTAGAALAQGMRGPMGDGPAPMMSQMDADKDGKITRAEIEAFNKARAAEIDADKDGKVTAAELRIHMDKQRETRMAERLGRFDKDGDGSVSVKEFEDAGMWRAARMDRNGDGIIDQADRRSMRRDGHGEGRHHDKDGRGRH